MYKALYHVAVATLSQRNLMSRTCRALLRRRNIRLVLVFGMSRSGTSFLSTVLAMGDPNTKQVHEPVQKIFRAGIGRQDNGSNDSDAFWDHVFSEKNKTFKVHILVCFVLSQILSGKIKRGQTLCIKPIALYDEVEQAAQATGARVVFITRHPCGRSESIARQKKQFEGKSAISLEDFRSLGAEWGKAHARAEQQFAASSNATSPNAKTDWSWVVFEELCHNPQDSLQALYEDLALPWTAEVAERIQAMTTQDSDAFYSTVRNSRAQADKWKTALSEAEIDAIRQGGKSFQTKSYRQFFAQS